MDNWGDGSEAHGRKERDAARLLRKSRWWQTRINQGVCYYCMHPVPKAAVTMDHIVPVAQGGRSIPSNVVVACKPCNTAKRDLTAADWLLHLAAKGSNAPAAKPHEVSDDK